MLEDYVRDLEQAHLMLSSSDTAEQLEGLHLLDGIIHDMKIDCDRREIARRGVGIL